MTSDDVARSEREIAEGKYAGLPELKAGIQQRSDNEGRVIYNSDIHKPTRLNTIRSLRMEGARVHLKCLDDNVYMLIVENSERYIYVKLTTRSKRGKIDAWVYEESAIDETELANSLKVADSLTVSNSALVALSRLRVLTRNRIGDFTSPAWGEAIGVFSTIEAALTAAPATEPVCDRPHYTVRGPVLRPVLGLLDEDGPTWTPPKTERCKIAQQECVESHAYISGRPYCRTHTVVNGRELIARYPDEPQKPADDR